VIAVDGRNNRFERPRRNGRGPNRTICAYTLLTTFSVVLCSSGPYAATTPPAAIDACALLTSQEISAVVGKSVGTGQAYDDGITTQGAHSTTCVWAAPLPPGVAPDPAQRLEGRGFVVLNVMNWPAGSNGARQFLDDFQEAFRQHDIDSKPVSVNVGADDALWWGDGVAVRRNGFSFGISVAQFGDPAARKPQAEGLATLVVTRLPAQHF